MSLWGQGLSQPTPHTSLQQLLGYVMGVSPSACLLLRILAPADRRRGPLRPGGPGKRVKNQKQPRLCPPCGLAPHLGHPLRDRRGGERGCRRKTGRGSGDSSGQVSCSCSSAPTGRRTCSHYSRGPCRRGHRNNLSLTTHDTTPHSGGSGMTMVSEDGEHFHTTPTE